MSRAPYKRPEVVTDEFGRTHVEKPVWNHDTMSIHILTNGQESWLSVGDLAKVVWQRNSEHFRKAVRRRLPALKRWLALNYNRLLVVEYNDARGSASAVKVYDREAPGDVQAMDRMIRDMKARKDKMLGYYQKVTGLSGLEPEE